jgi:hypothetical protein
MHSRARLLLAQMLRLAFLVLALAVGVARSQDDPIGPEFRVNTYTTDRQVAPVVAGDASGNFVVIWMSDGQDGNEFGVFGQRYDSGGVPLGAEFRVNTETTNVQMWPSVAMGASGDFLVTWDNGGDVFGQRYAATGVPQGPEFRINTSTTGQQYFSSVADDSTGNFIVVWTSENPRTVQNAFGQRFAASGAPLGPQFRVNTLAANGVSASVAAGGSGGFVVVWHRSYAFPLFDSDIYGRRFDAAGSPVGPEFRVNSDTAGSHRSPRVAADSAGNFVVAWHEQNTILARRYDAAGAPAGPEFRVNSYAIFPALPPALGVGAAGEFIVVWDDHSGQDGSGDGVFAQRYTSAGVPFGGEFRVNTYTTDWQGHPGVAVHPDGRFVVAWDSYTQDGSSWGIFGQRFSAIVPVELLQFDVE